MVSCPKRKGRAARAHGYWVFSVVSRYTERLHQAVQFVLCRAVMTAAPEATNAAVMYKVDDVPISLNKQTYDCFVPCRSSMTPMPVALLEIEIEIDDEQLCVAAIRHAVHKKCSDTSAHHTNV